jgi:chorismate dehydratase
MKTFSVGCVPFLNAAPLIARLDPGIEVILDVPSKLPALLAEGRVEAILVSSIEIYRDMSLLGLHHVGIASSGPVLSVRLLSPVPIDDVTHWIPDPASMTSNALMEVLFRDRFGISPRRTHESGPTTAQLLIGDAGMRAVGSTEFEYDLGEEWTNLTGLPFVWALWIGHADISQELTDRLSEGFKNAKPDWESVVRESAIRYGFDEELTRRYLSENVEFELTPRHMEGFEQFGIRLARYGLIPLPAVIP